MTTGPTITIYEINSGMACASGSLATTTLPSIAGRMVWSCPACGHANDHRLSHSAWQVECHECHHVVDVSLDSIPRGSEGRSRHHYALWLRRLSRRYY